jgi:hypothetical protein
VNPQEQNSKSPDEQRRKTKQTPSRRGVVRCGDCSKSLGTFLVSRNEITSDNTEDSFRFYVRSGERYSGGVTVRCSRKKCGAGPRAFPDDQYWDLLLATWKNGESSLRLSLRTD